MLQGKLLLNRIIFIDTHYALRNFLSKNISCGFYNYIKIQIYKHLNKKQLYCSLLNKTILILKHNNIKELNSIVYIIYFYYQFAQFSDITFVKKKQI